MAKFFERLFISFLIFFLFFSLLSTNFYKFSKATNTSTSSNMNSSFSAQNSSFTLCPSLLSCLRKLQIILNYFSDKMRIFSFNGLIDTYAQEEEYIDGKHFDYYVHDDEKMIKKENGINFYRKREKEDEVAKDLYIVSNELIQTILHTKRYIYRYYKHEGDLYDLLDVAFRKGKNLHNALKKISFSYCKHGLNYTTEIGCDDLKQNISKSEAKNLNFYNFEYLDEIERKTKDFGQIIFILYHANLYSLIDKDDLVNVGEIENDEQSVDNHSNTSVYTKKSFYNEAFKKEKRNFGFDMLTAAEKLSNFEWKHINNMFLHKANGSIATETYDEGNEHFLKGNEEGKRRANEEQEKPQAFLNTSGIYVEKQSDLDYLDICIEEKLIEMIKILAHDVHTLTYEISLLAYNSMNAILHTLYKTLKYTELFLSSTYQHPPLHFFDSDAYTVNSLTYPMIYLYSQHECKNSYIYFNKQEIHELSNSLKTLIVLFSVLNRNKRQSRATPETNYSGKSSDYFYSNVVQHVNNDSHELENEEFYINNKFDIFNANGRKNLMKIEKDINFMGKIIEKIVSNLHEKSPKTDLFYASNILKHFHFDLQNYHINTNLYLHSKDEIKNLHQKKQTTKQTKDQNLKMNTINQHQSKNVIFLSCR